MPVKMIFNKGKVPVEVYTDDIDSSAIDQLNKISQLPFIHHHIAVMPDVHTGIGATVGSVIPTIGAIIPAAVGVDIGCGMNAIRLSLDATQLPDNLHRIRNAIEAAVPVGFEQHDADPVKHSTIISLDTRLERILEKHPSIQRKKNVAFRPWVRQLGTLGGGNHFIEICLDESDQVWIMLHSGSRNIGNVMGTYFTELAKKDMGALLGTIPDKDLAYLTEGTKHFDDYMEAVSWAQDYAMINRREMLNLILKAIKPVLPPFETNIEAVNCHHNYVSTEEHYNNTIYVTRKGAISAYRGQLGIIPGSMGAKSYIVKGLGNENSFCSCSHGAGRRMSRSAAKRKFNINDVENQTQGVECRKDSGIIDEIPQAYKDIDQVMANQSDLVEIVHTLKQIICVKG
ncbi:Fis family transcriptional regulator [Achromatium sp. WMS2]|nr:Fis family transcriptional regulator [Achromatium sp. WMS2]